MKALRQADSLVYEACHTLDCRQWAVEVLCREEDVSSPQPPDALDQLIACARALTDDVRQTASFIQVSKCFQLLYSGSDDLVLICTDESLCFVVEGRRRALTVSISK